MWVSKCLGLQKIQVKSREGARACVAVSVPASVFCNVCYKNRGGKRGASRGHWRESERVRESPAETECISKSLSECKKVKHAVSDFGFFFFFKSTHRTTGECMGERVNVKAIRRATKSVTELAFSISQQNMWKRKMSTSVPGRASWTKTYSHGKNY